MQALKTDSHQTQSGQTRSALSVFLGFALIYGVIAIGIGPSNPLYRLGLIPVLGFYFYQKQKFDAALLTLSQSFKPKFNITKILFVLMLVLVLVRLIFIVNRIVQPISFIEDIAQVYQSAIHGLFRFPPLNPYSEVIDSYCVPWRGVEHCFTGLKYPPVQLFTYAPWVSLFGLKGIYLLHAPIYFALAALIFRYLKKTSNFHAYLGVILFLATDSLFVLAFNNGTNDLLPTYLLTYSLISLRSKNKSQSGIALGLSLAAKQLPAGFLIPAFLFQKAIRPVWIATALTLTLCSVFIFWNPSAFLDNVFWFNLVRPARNSSFLADLPSVFQNAVTLIGLGLYLYGCKLGRNEKNWNINTSFQLPALGLFILLITAKMSPFHYFMWLTPVMILWMVEPLQNSSLQIKP
jgi:hypothetical protein